MSGADPRGRRPVEGGSVAAGPATGVSGGPGRRGLRARRAVAIGGGTGLPLVLKCLHSLATEVVAVVSVADNGGSSGRLREELGMLPPGDLRKCLVALADRASPLARLFEYRFPAGEGLEGHTLGNLVIAALVDVEGDFVKGVARAGELVGARGQVLPSTVADVTLFACAADGRTIAGQYDIATLPKEVHSVYIEPGDAPVFGPTRTALEDADLVVVGPGSLYTSILPNLLVAGVPEAIRASRGLRVFVTNVATQPGETDGYSAADHLDAIARHVGPGLVDIVVVNDTRPDADRDARLAARGLSPILDDGTLGMRAAKVVSAPIASAEDPARHDCGALCAVLAGLLDERGA